MGINMKRAGKTEDAFSYYQKALTVEPNNSIILYNKGILHNVQNQYNEAIEQL